MRRRKYTASANYKKGNRGIFATVNAAYIARSSFLGSGLVYLIIKQSDFIMGKSYNHLTITNRLQIEAWQRVKIKPQQMAVQLGVHISTIYRELKRGEYEHLNTDYTKEKRYSADIAEQRYQESLRAKGADLKIGSDRIYAEYIEYKIREEKYSPAAVLGEIEAQGLEFNTTVSKTTLYSYIDKGIFSPSQIRTCP